jgi:hypothetical protein
MDVQQLKELIKRELPAMLQDDEEIKRFILSVARQQFADKGETNSHFDRLLDELRRDREEQNRKWEEQNRKWEENQKTITHMIEAIQALVRKQESTIGALGARWGLHSEQAFRNALKGILSESFGVEVLSIAEFDDEGEVFGQPDQVELDLIIKNGLLIICEIKSSVSRADMYAFGRKVKFYEKRHQRRADRMLVISPMVDSHARQVAYKLGIQVYSYAEEVDPLQITPR